ncbi:uncharacterized protein LOC120908507 isoform X2 [Anopheles arabiensis]|uniref:uncharacterized protein LOC120908507 isoform X2 n=1 Tax=Anopheles arabiensis TaxID=7173 RepID=UPI001AAD5138|nr:uncharacterized protein LOC120908507 isoform X2 [Anopheles arabiensis]
MKWRVQMGATFAACVADSASSRRNSLLRLHVVATESIPSNRRKTFLKKGIKAPRWKLQRDKERYTPKG